MTAASFSNEIEEISMDGFQVVSGEYFNRRTAYFFYLLEIGFKSGGKHYQNNAYFSEETDPLHRGRGQNLLIRYVIYKSEKYSRYKHSDDRRKTYFLAEFNHKF